MADGLLVGVLLAAGMGRRFGSDKLLHPLVNGQQLAQAAATALVAACDHTVAVVRPGNVRLAELLASAGCEIVECAEAVQGMGHSLASGVRATPTASAWLMALADMPCIAPQTYRAVTHALRSGSAIAAPTCGGQRGHPVGFGRQWFEQLSRLGGDEGARSILAEFPEAITPCPVEDEGIWRDVDRPSDLARLFVRG